MQINQKVYWVKGVPNNGRGTIVFKIPFLSSWYLVRDESGKLIACNRVYDLEESIKQKQETVESLNGSCNSELERIREWNIKEIEKGLEYLYDTRER